MNAMGMMVIKEKAREFFYRQYQGFNTLTVRILSLIHISMWEFF